MYIVGNIFVTFTLFHIVIIVLILILKLFEWISHCREVESLSVRQSLLSELLLRPLEHLPVESELKVSLMTMCRQNRFVNIACQLSETASFE